MNQKYLLLGFLFVANILQAQRSIEKPLIDASVYGKWPSVSSTSISNNGQYVAYMINNQPVGKKTLVIQSTDSKWKKEFPGIGAAEFTPDSRYAIYSIPGDSLVLLTLGKGTTEFITNSQSYQLADDGNWMVYQLNSGNRNVIAYNLKTKERKSYEQVYNYWISNNGKNLIFQSVSANNKALQSLNTVSLESGKQNQLWEGVGMSNMLYDGLDRIAFIADEKQEGKITRSIWFYKTEMPHAELFIQETAATISKDLKIGALTRFSKKGDKIFITLKENKPFRPAQKPKQDVVKMTVWSYTDSILQSNQAGSGGTMSMIGSISQEYVAVADIESKKMIRLEQEKGELNDKKEDAFFLTRTLKAGADGFEKYWNNAISTPLNLVNAKDGKRKELNEFGDAVFLDVSPAEKFLLYWDESEHNFFTYEITTGIKRNITKSITPNWSAIHDDDIKTTPSPPAGWLADDESVLLYDRYDIWQVDPTGEKKPINLTNGYGQQHKIAFRLAMEGNNLPGKILVSPDKGKLLLNALNLETKENGFYTVQIGRSQEPELLSMGPFCYQIKGSVSSHCSAGMEPIKARDAKMFVVQRMSASLSPNLYATTDFNTFTPLTNIHPEKDYNWISTELHTWKSNRGDTIQGILYKPENFDPNKQYSVIMYYYVRLSEKMHHFLSPDFSNGILNIPWYVSNGYLVFCPDIHITKAGETGKCAADAVVSGAEYLSKMPYVNSKKIGIQGLSFGGFETYYIVTHSNIFAAACAGAGMTDLISFYNDLRGDGISQQPFAERSVYMYATPWEAPEWYIENSAVFNADKVTSPLLMFSTSVDGAVAFSQAMEFYLSMRRLGKRAWLLEYEEGNHAVQGKSAEDYTIRMTQFFGHYLKDEPAPKWMTRGVPAKMGGIDGGLELDKEIKTPGPGLTIDNINQK
jgi:predicted peptidase